MKDIRHAHSYKIIIRSSENLPKTKSQKNKPKNRRHAIYTDLKEEDDAQSGRKSIESRLKGRKDTIKRDTSGIL